MSGVHSSLTPRYQPLPKSPTGRTRAQDKAAKDAAAAANWDKVCKLVDRRDMGHCRVCGRACSTTAIDMTQRAERHHLVFRSQGGEDSTANVLTICKLRCHADIHTHGTLQLSGNADQRDERGRFNGVRVERQREHGWEVVAWI